MGASSTASARVSDSTAPQMLAATAQPGPGRRPAMPVVKVIEPPGCRCGAAEMRTRHRRSAPVFRTVEEKLEHVAAGHGIVLLPLSTAVFYTRPGVAYSHVSDIPPNQVCLAWDATRRSRLIQDFAAIAADHPPLPGPAEPDRSSPSGPQTPAQILAQAGSRPVPQAG
jgi:hypothetical protein